MKHFILKSLLLLSIILQVTSLTASVNNDPLPSWNNGTTKQKIIRFVHNVTNPKNLQYTKTEARIAVFDNDGTLWLEQPIYTIL